jgi:hypothetical protein
MRNSKWKLVQGEIQVGVLKLAVTALLMTTVLECGSAQLLESVSFSGGSEAYKTVQSYGEYFVSDEASQSAGLNGSSTVSIPAWSYSPFGNGSVSSGGETAGGSNEFIDNRQRLVFRQQLRVRIAYVRCDKRRGVRDNDRSNGRFRHGYSAFHSKPAG